MKDGLVPPPPLGITPGVASSRAKGAEPAARKSSAFDEAFIGRVYRSMAWFGGLITLILVAGRQDIAGALSFVGGVGLAALLLRTQEVMMRAVMRPKTETAGIDPRLLMLFTLPVKYIVVIGVLVTLDHFHLIRPLYVGTGFFAGQLVLIAKIVGLMATRGQSTKKVAAS